MFLKITQIETKKLIGFATLTSLADDKTPLIWRQLMPRLKEVKNAVNADLFSVQVYDINSFQYFTSHTTFTKYALVEVKNYDLIPDQFITFKISQGQYAGFLHKGTSADFYKTLQFIFEEWLPNSQYLLDNRPHFAVMGDNYYGHENPNSEEEIWIPIL
ncbi:GyrI-like domain-containing protein [Flavobacterium chuncheonense]|uniref:GyrI-like domain-containing protein n=1 Tax=Flavobacterium chuncheonense TaxID=2026653 RepID=A0ABW5YLT7_9FLAO